MYRTKQLQKSNQSEDGDIIHNGIRDSLSLDDDCFDPTGNRYEVSTPPDRREAEEYHQYEHTSDEDHLKRISRQTNYDGDQIKSLLYPISEPVLPHLKTRRTPYISHFDSYQIQNLMNPPRGIRDEMMRRGITPRDHHKANIAAIAMRSAKLHNIKNGIQDDVPSHGTPCTLRSSMSSRNGISGLDNGGVRCETPDNASVSTAENSPRIDFMARNIENIATAMAAGRKKVNCNVKEKQTSAHEDYGKVPAYLSRRKHELEQDRERRIQQEKDKHLPPGLVLMKNAERLEVLKTLETNKERLVDKLSAMPLVVETPTQIRAKANVDEQLKEVEDSIKRFSRPKVYIRYDN